jgi:hypothetical protein
MRSLLEQVRAAAPTTAAAVDSPKSPRTVVVSGGESEEVNALRSELDSLRTDLAKAATRRVAADDQIADSVTLAPIPAEVPPLSLSCRPTVDMEKLKMMLISTNSDDSTMAVTATKSKVGALGMVSGSIRLTPFPVLSSTTPTFSEMCNASLLLRREVLARRSRLRGLHGTRIFADTLSWWCGSLSAKRPTLPAQLG